MRSPIVATVGVAVKLSLAPGARVGKVVAVVLDVLVDFALVAVVVVSTEAW
jgi:hypothetical protein